MELEQLRKCFKTHLKSKNIVAYVEKELKEVLNLALVKDFTVLLAVIVPIDIALETEAKRFVQDVNPVKKLCKKLALVDWDSCHQPNLHRRLLSPWYLIVPCSKY